MWSPWGKPTITRCGVSHAATGADVTVEFDVPCVCVFVFVQWVVKLGSLAGTTTELGLVWFVFVLACGLIFV